MKKLLFTFTNQNDGNLTKFEEIKLFQKFYNSLHEDSYLKSILDGIPEYVKERINNDEIYGPIETLNARADIINKLETSNEEKRGELTRLLNQIKRIDLEKSTISDAFKAASQKFQTEITVLKGKINDLELETRNRGEDELDRVKSLSSSLKEAEEQIEEEVFHIQERDKKIMDLEQKNHDLRVSSDGVIINLKDDNRVLDATVRALQGKLTYAYSELEKLTSPNIIHGDDISVKDIVFLRGMVTSQKREIETLNQALKLKEKIIDMAAVHYHNNNILNDQVNCLVGRHKADAIIIHDLQDQEVKK